MAEPLELVGTYRDQANKEATNTLYVTDGLTIAQMTEGVQALVQLIDEVLNAVIRGFDFVLSVDLSGLTGNSTGQTSDVQEVGEFIFATGANRPVVLNLPCINDAASPAGSDDIDQSDTDMAAIIAMMEDGLVVTGGTIIPTDVDQNDIVQLVTARERMRNSGSRS